MCVDVSTSQDYVVQVNSSRLSIDDHQGLWPAWLIKGNDGYGIVVVGMLTCKPRCGEDACGITGIHVNNWKRDEGRFTWSSVMLYKLHHPRPCWPWWGKQNNYLLYEVHVCRWVLCHHIDKLLVRHWFCNATFSSWIKIRATPTMDTSEFIFDLRMQSMLLETGVTAAIIHMPRNVFLASRVQMLWSTLSSAYWTIQRKSQKCHFYLTPSIAHTYVHLLVGAAESKVVKNIDHDAKLW